MKLHDRIVVVTGGAQVPMGRMGRPDEIAAAAVQLKVGAGTTAEAPRDPHPSAMRGL